jgi:F-type H+-transporting ATPase subunit epsilon
VAESVTFRVSVVTPERTVLERQASFAALPAWDGEIGILRGRAPLVAKLGPGVLRVRGGEGGEEHLYVDGGFAEMVGDRLTVLTESAHAVAELDRAAAERELAQALAMKAADEKSQAERQRALTRARARLRAAGRG